MIHIVDSAPPRPEAAYAVPWSVDRRELPWCTLTNESADTLSFVSTQFFGHGAMEPAVPRHAVAPGGSIRFVVWGADAIDSARITVHWRVEFGSEYAWTFVL